jgi:hypothetical protein
VGLIFSALKVQTPLPFLTVHACSTLQAPEAASEQWEAFVDPVSGRQYLTNAATGESKWADEEQQQAVRTRVVIER